MTMFTLLFAVFAAAGEMSTADPYLLCVKNQGKTLASIKDNGFHLFDDGTRQKLSDDLIGHVACEGARTADPCGGLKGIGAPIGGTDAKLEGNVIKRCEHAALFSGFMNEMYSAKKEQKKFPYCMKFFGQAPIFTITPNFEELCPKIAERIQAGKDDFCDAKMDPYVKDKRNWPAICKAVGANWLRGDNSVCTMFPAPERCMADGSLSAAFVARNAEACPSGVEGGICRAYMPKGKYKRACEGSWARLQSDFCSAMVSSALVVTKGEPAKMKGKKKKKKVGGDESPSEAPAAEEQPQ